MKVTRTNKCKRIMKHYCSLYGYGTPYSILMTGSFCNEALQFKVQVKEQLENYFSHEVRIVTTQCCIHEIEQLSKINFGLQGGWLILKKFLTVKCGHEGRPVISSVCLKSVLGGARKYILATMDRELWKSVQKSQPGVPILYQYGPAPTLIKPRTLNEKVDKSEQFDEEDEIENEHMHELIENLKKKQELSKKRKLEEEQNNSAEYEIENEETTRKQEKKLARKRKREEEQSKAHEEIEDEETTRKQEKKRLKKRKKQDEEQSEAAEELEDEETMRKQEKKRAKKRKRENEEQSNMIEDEISILVKKPKGKKKKAALSESSHGVYTNEGEMIENCIETTPVADRVNSDHEKVADNDLEKDNKKKKSSKSDIEASSEDSQPKKKKKKPLKCDIAVSSEELDPKKKQKLLESEEEISLNCESEHTKKKSKSKKK